MQEELEQQTRELPQLTNLEPELFDLAKCLVQYHRHALGVRSQGLADNAAFDPPEVRELMNFLLWCGDGFNIIDKNEQILSLSLIIRESAENVRKIIEEVRKFGATEHLAYEVNYANAQLAAADVLIGLLSDG